MATNQMEWINASHLELRKNVSGDYLEFQSMIPQDLQPLDLKQDLSRSLYPSLYKMASESTTTKRIERSNDTTVITMPYQSRPW